MENDSSDMDSEGIAEELVAHWNEYLVSAFIGLPNTDITHLLFNYSPPPSPSTPILSSLPAPPIFPEPLILPDLQNPASLTGRVHYIEPSKEENPAKRPYLHPPSIQIRRRIPRYRYLKLQSGATFYFSDDDGKDILTTSEQEPNLYIRKLLSHLPKGVRDRLIFLSQFSDEQEIRVIDADLEETDEWITPTSQDLDPLTYLFTDLREQLFTAYLREMRMRRIFRFLLQRWRIRRIDRKEHVTTDPITLAEPVKPVIIYNIPQMTRFTYDARSLATWIESNLSYHEGGFAIPMTPRNPWTNQEFTFIQLLSIYEQLRHHGELRWGLTTLRAHQFHLAHWKLFHLSALTLSAIRKSLTRLDSTDGRELLEDFIFAKMDDLHIYTSPAIRQLYRKAILYAPMHWYLEEFKAIAYLHYEADHFQQDKHRMIHNRCDRIFKKQDQFIEEIQQMGILVRPRPL